MAQSAHGKRECNGGGSWGQSEANQIMQVPTESVVVGSRRRRGGFSTTFIPKSPLFYIAATNAPLVSPSSGLVCTSRLPGRALLIPSTVGRQIVPDRRPSD